MEYAKVDNGIVTQVGLPKTGTLKDGSTVSGYNLLDEITLKNEGWLPVIKDIPSYNSELEYIEQDGEPQIVDGHVIYKYIVKPIEIPVEVEPTIQELQQQLIYIQNKLNELQNTGT